MDDFPNSNGNNVPNNNVNDANNVANNAVNNPNNMPNNAVDPNVAVNSNPNNVDPNLGYMYSPDMANYYDNTEFTNSDISGFYDNTGFMDADTNNGYDTTGFMDANPNMGMDNGGFMNVDPNAGLVNPDMNGGFANVDNMGAMNQNVDNGFGNTGFTNPNMNAGADMTFDPNMAVDNTGFMNVDPNMGVNNVAPNMPMDNLGAVDVAPNMPIDNLGVDANANFDNPVTMDPNMNNPMDNSGAMNFDPIMSADNTGFVNADPNMEVDNTGFMNTDPNMPIDNLGVDTNANFDNPVIMDPNMSNPMDNSGAMNFDPIMSADNTGFINTDPNMPINSMGGDTNANFDNPAPMEPSMNAGFDQNQNMDPNYQNNNLNNNNMNNNVQNNKPKKSNKGILTILVALIFVVLIAIVGLFIFKNMNKNKNNNQVPTNTVDTSVESITADEKGLMSIDFSTLPEDNEYLKDVDSQKAYKILKPTGTVEGLLNITDEDIYKVTIDTDNIMIFKGAKAYNADFIMLDIDGLAHEAVFSVTDKEDEYKKLMTTDPVGEEAEEQTDNQTEESAEEQVEEQADNQVEDEIDRVMYKEWSYRKTEDGGVCFHPFNRHDGDYAIASFTVKGDNFKDMSDEKFAEFMETVIDCIKLERTEEFNPDNGIEYSNILSNVDMYNIPISNGIVLDLATHFKIDTYTIQGYPDAVSTTVDKNSLVLDSKDDRYRVTINESTEKTLEEIKNDANTYHYNWESVSINDEEAFIEYKEDGKFRALYIDRDGVIITIGVAGLGEDKNVSMEDAVNYLGENLFK